MSPGGRLACSAAPETAGGHQGAGRVLCVPQAAYLQRTGVNTAVFERRHVIGGAAVTEEIIPGEPEWWSGGSGGVTASDRP